MRLLSTLFLLFSLFFTLLFFNRLTICEKIIISQLQKIGAADIQVTVADISPSRLVISALSCDMNGKFSLAESSLHDLQLTFSPAKLAAGKVTTLRIDSLQIELAASVDKGNKAVDPAALARIQLPSFLPQQLSISKLILSGACPPAIAGRVLQVEAQLLPLQQKADIFLVHEKIKLSATRDTVDDFRQRFELQGSLQNKEFFNLSLQQDIDKTTGTLSASLTPAVAAISRILPSSLPDLAGHTEITFSIPAAPLQPENARMAFQMTDTAISNWHIRSLSGELSVERAEKANIILGNGSFLVAEGIKRADLFMDKISLTPLVEIQLADNTQTVRVSEGFRAELLNLQTAETVFPAIRISPVDSVSLQRRTDGKIYLNDPATSIQLGVDPVQHNDFTVTLSPATLTLTNSKTDPLPEKLQAVLQIPKADILRHGSQFSLVDILFDLTKENREIFLKSAFSPADNPGRLHISLHHSFADRNGNIHITTAPSLAIDTEQENIQQLFSPFNLPFTLSNGTLQTELNGRWQADKLLFLKSKSVIADLEGTYNNLLFRGVSLRQNLQLFPELKSIGCDQFFMEELNAGIVFTNTSINSRISPSLDPPLPLLTIDSIETQLFGGTLSAADIPVKLSQPDISAEILFDGIDTEKSELLKKVAGLRVSGILDGAVTMDIHNKQFSISKGKMVSRPSGGLISYIPPGGPGSLPQIPEVAMLALQEFHYNSLVAVPRYESNGNLIINIQTKGKSPKLDSKRPVHLNLNVEQNLLSLLKSLRYTGTLTDDLEKHLQNQSKGGK